ncbi:DUF1294 domain-containing protein [Rhodanobacter sp. Root561]|uniref:DUF1294 domain-containing protein n=1 Tax=Rhodanobacter sp. Root561 TaxID=1736560 RepID=UPI0012FA135B|nr:DUF1294 domain-containing protein [Rhodanobacter sp. Root561]
MSLLSCLMYRADKSAAQEGRRRSRTPESHLHLVDLIGGWPGALIAQQQFRHKTEAHFSFRFLGDRCGESGGLCLADQIRLRSRPASIACRVTAAAKNSWMHRLSLQIYRFTIYCDLQTISGERRWGILRCWRCGS